MKKIKLLAGFGAAFALSGAAVASSCAWHYTGGDEPIPPQENTVYDGKVSFKSAQDIIDYASKGNWIVENMSAVTVREDDGASVKSSLLDPYIKAGHIADGFATAVAYSSEDSLPDDLTGELTWSTTESEIKVVLVLKATVSGTEMNMTHTNIFKKITSSYFDQMTDILEGGLKPENFTGTEISRIWIIPEEGVITEPFGYTITYRNEDGVTRYFPLSKKDLPGKITITPS